MGDSDEDDVRSGNVLVCSTVGDVAIFLYVVDFVASSFACELMVILWSVPLSTNLQSAYLLVIL